MALRSIEQEWNDYAAKVIAKDAPEVQLRETKMAFFAGAWALFTALEEISEPHISEAEGEAYLTARRAEIRAFVDRLMARYAAKN